MNATRSKGAVRAAMTSALFLTTGSLFAAPDLEEIPKPSVADYYGKWELLLANSGDTFQSCMIDLFEKDGQPKAEMIWKWASVQHIGAKALKVTDDGVLEISKPGWANPLRLRRLGDAIQGSVEHKNGKKDFVTGRLGRWVVDASGAWSVRSPRDGRSLGMLWLLPLGAGRYRAVAKNDEGHTLDIKSLSVVENRLTMNFVADEGQTKLQLACEIRGDQLFGKILNADSSAKELVVGGRKRRWGKPVDLLAGGLDDFRPRDPRRKYGWKIENDILTNSPPDVDIVTKAEFQDFKLNLEYKVERPKGKRSNSGIYIRGRYEVQILDDWNDDPKKRRVQRHGNGAVYSRIVPEKFASAAPGEWQQYEITIIDRFLTVKLNGKIIVNNRRLVGITGGALLPFESEPGPLMLQGDHGKIEYRNVKVTPALPPSL